MADQNIIELIIRLKDEASSGLSSLHSSLERFHTMIGGGSGVLSDYTRSIIGLAAAYASFQGIKGLAEGFFETERAAKSTEMQFGALLGSAQAASAALDELRAAVEKTPFSFEQARDASRTFVMMGLDLDTWLKPALDAAAFSGRDLAEVFGALGRAATLGGAGARVLRQLGLLPAVNAVAELRFGLKAAELDAAQMQEAMIAAFEDPTGRVAGAAEKMSKGWAGMMARLSDMWHEFQIDVMNEGVWDSITAKAKALRDQIQEWADSGDLARWAKNISDAVQWLIDKAVALGTWIANHPTMVELVVGSYIAWKVVLVDLVGLLITAVGLAQTLALLRLPGAIAGAAAGAGAIGAGAGLLAGGAAKAALPAATTVAEEAAGVYLIGPGGTSQFLPHGGGGFGFGIGGGEGAVAGGSLLSRALPWAGRALGLAGLLYGVYQLGSSIYGDVGVGGGAEVRGKAQADAEQADEEKRGQKWLAAQKGREARELGAIKTQIDKEIKAFADAADARVALDTELQKKLDEINLDATQRRMQEESKKLAQIRAQYGETSQEYATQQQLMTAVAQKEAEQRTKAEQAYQKAVKALNKGADEGVKKEEGRIDLRGTLADQVGKSTGDVLPGVQNQIAKALRDSSDELKKLTEGNGFLSDSDKQLVEGALKAKLAGIRDTLLQEQADTQAQLDTGQAVLQEKADDLGTKLDDAWKKYEQGADNVSLAMVTDLQKQFDKAQAALAAFDPGALQERMASIVTALATVGEPLQKIQLDMRQGNADTVESFKTSWEGWVAQFKAWWTDINNLEAAPLITVRDNASAVIDLITAKIAVLNAMIAGAGANLSQITYVGPMGQQISQTPQDLSVDLQGYANGTTLYEPTLLIQRGRILGVAGEAGPEDIVPRGRSASRGGGPVNIYISEKIDRAFIRNVLVPELNRALERA